MARWTSTWGRTVLHPRPAITLAGLDNERRMSTALSTREAPALSGVTLASANRPESDDDSWSPYGSGATDPQPPEVVTMLQRRNPVSLVTTAKPTRRRTFWLWLLMAGDLAVVLWMQAVGEWLDRTSTVTAIATLGGHHVVVMVLAGSAFTMLAATATLTAGLTAMSRPESVLVALACVMSVVVLAGILSFLVVGVVLRLVGLKL
jgi:hypothetical protein